MALYLSQNFAPPKYLESQLVEFHQILYMHFFLARSSLGLLHIIFRKFVPELWPLINAKYLENYITYFHQILFMHSY